MRHEPQGITDPDKRGWYDLASAIIDDAACEYRMMRVLELKGMRPGASEAARRFFLTQFFADISGVSDAYGFVRKLEEQTVLMYNEGRLKANGRIREDGEDDDE